MLSADHPDYSRIPLPIYRSPNDQRLIEIAETAIERDNLLAEWIRLTDSKDNSSQVAMKIAKDGSRRGRPGGGINAAARDLGIDKDDAHRAVKVASLAPEAKRTAKNVGLDDNRSKLLEAADEPSPEAQVAYFKREAAKKAASKANRDKDRQIAEGHAGDFAAWIKDRCDPYEIPMIISWLETCKSKL